MNLNDAPQRIRWLTVAILVGLAVIISILDATGNLDAAFGVLRDPLTAVLRITSGGADTVAGALSGPRDLEAARARDFRDPRILRDLAVAMGSTRGASTMRMLTAAATENEEISRRLHDKFSGPLQEQAMARVASAPDLTATYEERRAAVDAIIGLILFRVLAHQEVGRADAADLVRALTVGLRGSAVG